LDDIGAKLQKESKMTDIGKSLKLNYDVLKVRGIVSPNIDYTKLSKVDRLVDFHERYRLLQDKAEPLRKEVKDKV
jgi:hypothetical protein